MLRFTVCLALLCLALAPAALLAEDQSLINSTLWAATAVERNALTLQTYAQARTALDKALKDKNWTAAVEQQKLSHQKLPLAIILDVDETVLDNSPFQAQQILEGGTYDPQKWNVWVNKASAAALPGAREYTNYAHSRGVTVFFVTNRDAELETATRANLQKEGFPLDAKMDTVYTRGEKPEWRSDKTTRRAEIAQHYRILQLFGDDLGDFISGANGTTEERRKLVEPHAQDWGTKWFALPNAMYGSWENTLFGSLANPTEEQRLKIKMDLLRRIAP